MAITVVVEDGSGVAGANSYRTTAQIDAWVLTNPHDTTWAALAQAAKDGYAVMACRVMNEHMDWDGWVVDADQALDLPRSGMVDKNGNAVEKDEIPEAVQNAQCELARLLAIADRTADADTAGFKEIGVGSIKLVIDKMDRPSVLPDAVWNMLKPFGCKAITKEISQTYRA